jgi:Zn-dependent peptidase ImmA (M78 family)
MDWRSAHREAMVIAFEAHEDLAIDTFARIDVFDAMAASGLRLVFRDLQDSAALYLPAHLGGTPGAIIKAQHPLALQRYSGAHEYGHHLFGHGEQIDRNSEPRGTGAALAPAEKLAEAFASWFLMPPEAVDAVLERIGITDIARPHDAYALALRLGTSFSATCTHLPSLKLVPGGTAEQWRALALKGIKQELTTSPPPGGWKNDVWVLGPEDASVELVVRAGDRLLLDLPAWDIDHAPHQATVTRIEPTDLLSSPRWQVDLPPDMPPGPTRLSLRDPSTTVTFTLCVEQPRRGRYVRTIALAR